MIKKIIHTFLHNPMPEQVQQQFRTWCLNKERAGEKTDALWKEWERLDPASVLPADEKAYRRKLDRLHREMTPPAAPKRGLFSITRRTAAAAAAIVLLAMSVEFFVVKRLSADTTTWLVTAENSKGRFMLPDGSVVWLNADSRLAYSDRFTASGSRAVRLEGEAYFEVAKNKDKRFIVCCNDLEIEALGTTFDVKGYCDDHSVTTLLAEGSVKVSNKTDVTLLKPGEKVEYHKNKQTFTKSPISDMREIDFWRNNMLIFNSSSLAEIATTLERMYGVKVVFDSEKLKNVPFSGTIRNSSLHNVFYIISLTYPLTYELEGDTVRIGSSIN